MHRIGNTNAIKPNWRALVPDDGPSLSLSIEATASGATYVFRAFGDTFNVAFESKEGTFDDVFAPTSVTPTVLVPVGQSVSVPPGVGNVGIDDTVLPSEPGQSYTVRFRGTSGDTVVTGERVYTLPDVIVEATLMPDELPLGRTTLLFNVEANAACTIDYSLTSDSAVTPVDEGSLTLGSGNPTAQHRFENLTPSTEYTCLYDVITPSMTVTEELVATTLAQIDQIGLTITLELAPPPNNGTTIRLFVTVDAACTCEVVILGPGSVPPRFTETFDAPTVRRQLEFGGLLPNSAYTANVVASAPDKEGNEQTASIVTADVVNELTVEAEPGETAFALQIAVTQTSTCQYTVIDPSQNVTVPSPQFEAGHNFTVGPVTLTSSKFAFSTWVYVSSSTVPAPGTEDSILNMTGAINSADEIFVSLKPDRRTRFGYKIDGYTAMSHTNDVAIPLDVWTHCAFVFVPREGGTKTRSQFYTNGVETWARSSQAGEQVGLILNQDFNVSVASTFMGQLANVAMWDDALYPGGSLDTLVNTNELVALQTNVVRFGFGAMALIGTTDIAGGDQTTVTVTELTPDTTYNCTVVAASAYPTVTKELTVSTLPQLLPDPVYALALLSVDDESAVIDARSNFDCILEYSNRPYQLIYETTTSFDVTAENVYLDPGGGNPVRFQCARGAPCSYECELTFTDIPTSVPYTSLFKSGRLDIGLQVLNEVVYSTFEADGTLSRYAWNIGERSQFSQFVRLKWQHDGENVLCFLNDVALPDEQTGTNDLPNTTDTFDMRFISSGACRNVRVYGFERNYSGDTKTVAVSKDVPAIITVRELATSTAYLFIGHFTPIDDAVAGGTREMQYTTTSTMQVVPQPAATPPNVGIVALPVLGKESVQLLLNVSCSRRGVAEMRVFNETAGGPIKNLAITNEADTGNAPAPPLQHFIAGFTADGFQLVTGLQSSTDYTIFVVKLYGEDGEAFDSDVSIEYRTADVDVTNELSIQVALDDQVGEDGSRPGETSFSLQMEVTQDSSCSYFVTDPANNEAIVLDGTISVSGGNSASVFVTGLTPNTLYNCSVVALSDYPTTQKQISATTLPPPLEIDAYLTTPAENGGTSLVANFVVSRSSSVMLTLTAEGETYSQEVQEGTQSFVFQNLTPSTLYTLTALATAIPDGSEASASDTRNTLAPPETVLDLRSAQTYGGGDSQKPVDSMLYVDSMTARPWGECGHYSSEWWGVDLGSEQQVARIRLQNRSDCCPERMSGLEIYLGNTPGTWVGNTLIESNVNPNSLPVLDVQIMETGRYIYVRRPPGNHIQFTGLTICKFYVFVFELVR